MEPRFIVRADPTHENYLHLRGADVGSAWIVVEATANRGIFSEFQGRTIVYTFADSSLRSLAGLLRDKGHLRAWGSVATMALDFALLLGCNPVILIRQDLAYSDGRSYCTRVFFEESWFSGLERLDSWRDRLAGALQGRNLIMIERTNEREFNLKWRVLARWDLRFQVLISGGQPGPSPANAAGVQTGTGVFVSFRASPGASDSQ